MRPTALTIARRFVLAWTIAASHGCAEGASAQAVPTEPMAAAVASPAKGAASKPAATSRVEVTILSTMLADRGIGEWGFAALVEVDGHRLLFDTGNRPDTVLRNAKTLDIDLATVTDVVLSHHHDDHVGGLVRLREAYGARDPEALARVHVARGMFASRRFRDRPREVNAMVRLRPGFERGGGRFVIHDRPAEIAPGVWVTGPVPRPHDERNWGPGRKVKRGGRWVEDTLAESQSLVIETPDGIIVLSGCGHAGMINTIDHAKAAIRDDAVVAAIGGFHLLGADDAHLAWTAEHLRGFGVQSFFGGHCTGLEPVYRFRAALGLPRPRAVVAAVGGRYRWPEGISPGSVAR